MIKERIDLYNRYGDETFLLKHSDDSYEFHFDLNSSCSVSFEDAQSGLIRFIDPAGGPLMSIGSTIEDDRVALIYPDRSSGVFIVKMCNGMLTYDEFDEDVRNKIHEMIIDYPMLRAGQTAYNYIHDKYKLSDIVKSEDGVDCFYDDSKTKTFIALAYKRYINKEGF